MSFQILPLQTLINWSRKRICGLTFNSYFKAPSQIQISTLCVKSRGQNLDKEKKKNSQLIIEHLTNAQIDLNFTAPSTLMLKISRNPLRCLRRGIQTSPNLLIKAHKMPPRPKINENEVREVFLKGGSGPGGQKINKTNSKVQLKHLPTGIIVECQATRSREQNRKKAREILAMKVQHLSDPENSRQAALEERKLQQANSKAKKSKKKYKEIDEERKRNKELEEREELEFLRKMMSGN